jgi:hypothetical protein
MLPIEPVEIGPAGTTTDNNPLLNEALGRVANTVFGAPPQQLVNAPTAELLVGPREHSKDIAIERGGDDCEWVSEVHGCFVAILIIVVISE